MARLRRRAEPDPVHRDHPRDAPARALRHPFRHTDRFLEDAEQGTLSTYSFIEPNLWGGHNDMHPAISALFPGVAYDPPFSLLGGEALLAKIYDAVRSSSSSTGSNCFNTLLMVVFDEHGGTYDHVPPPRATPPDPSAPPASSASVSTGSACACRRSRSRPGSPKARS
jgi:phospholipase C